MPYSAHICKYKNYFLHGETTIIMMMMMMIIIIIIIIIIYIVFQRPTRVDIELVIR
jgi:uncharacterized membrane protein